MGAKKVKGTEKKTDADPKWPTYELTYEDVVDILQIIDRSTCRELQVESGDFKLTVKKKIRFTTRLNVEWHCQPR